MNLKTVKIGNKNYPVHFGFAALIEINKICGIDKENFLSAFNLTSPEDRIKVAHIGLMEGSRLTGVEGVPEKFSQFCDFLDQRGESLAEILGVFYLQTFGEEEMDNKLSNLIDKTQILIDEAVKALQEKEITEKETKALENLQSVNSTAKMQYEVVKKQWPMLINPGKKLPSADFVKLPLAGSA